MRFAIVIFREFSALRCLYDAGSILNTAEPRSHTEQRADSYYVTSAAATPPPRLILSCRYAITPSFTYAFFAAFRLLLLAHIFATPPHYDDATFFAAADVSPLPPLRHAIIAISMPLFTFRQLPTYATLCRR